MHKTIKIMSVVAAIVFPSVALAGPVSIDQWYEFDFSGLGAALTGCSGSTCGLGTDPVPLFLSEAPWTFTTAMTAQLIVTDGFASGDQFQLFDNLASIGQTSAASTGVNCGSDITACLANSSMSKGAFGLAAGSHSITGAVTASAGSPGVGFFEIISPVPEPMTLSIFCASLVGTAAIRRRKAKS